MRTHPEQVIGLEQNHFPTDSEDDLMNSLKAVQRTPDGLFTQTMPDDALKAATGPRGRATDGDASRGGPWTLKHTDKAGAGKA